MSFQDKLNAPQTNNNSIIPDRSKHTPLDNYKAVIQRVRMHPKSFSPADTVLLQKTIGNHAVYQLMREIGVPLQAKKENNTGLPDDLKTGAENLSGLSMDDVRVNYNSDRPAQIGALAYTQGADIHVAPRQEKHLPHEVWHVVQQAQGRVQPTLQMQGAQVNDDEALEREADKMGQEIVQRAKMDTAPMEISDDIKSDSITAGVRGAKDVPVQSVENPEEGEEKGPPIQGVFGDVLQRVKYSVFGPTDKKATFNHTDSIKTAKKALAKIGVDTDSKEVTRLLKRTLCKEGYSFAKEFKFKNSHSYSEVSFITSHSRPVPRQSPLVPPKPGALELGAGEGLHPDLNMQMVAKMMTGVDPGFSLSASDPRFKEYTMALNQLRSDGYTMTDFSTDKKGFLLKHSEGVRRMFGVDATNLPESVTPREVIVSMNPYHYGPTLKNTPPDSTGLKGGDVDPQFITSMQKSLAVGGALHLLCKSNLLAECRDKLGEEYEKEEEGEPKKEKHTFADALGLSKRETRRMASKFQEPQSGSVNPYANLSYAQLIQIISEYPFEIEVSPTRPPENFSGGAPDTNKRTLQDYNVHLVFRRCENPAGSDKPGASRGVRFVVDDPLDKHPIISDWVTKI